MKWEFTLQTTVEKHRKRKISLTTSTEDKNEKFSREEDNEFNTYLQFTKVYIIDGYNCTNKNKKVNVAMSNKITYVDICLKYTKESILFLHSTDSRP